MQTWLALLRGVNVGGRNLVSMKALAASLEVAGFQAIQTYLQRKRDHRFADPVSVSLSRLFGNEVIHRRLAFVHRCS
ncbi:MAG: DUF1697 domain-containing protein [Pirellulaceae bacterium]